MKIYIQYSTRLRKNYMLEIMKNILNYICTYICTFMKILEISPYNLKKKLYCRLDIRFDAIFNFDFYDSYRNFLLVAKCFTI